MVVDHEQSADFTYDIGELHKVAAIFGVEITHINVERNPRRTYGSTTKITFTIKGPCDMDEIRKYFQMFLFEDVIVERA